MAALLVVLLGLGHPAPSAVAAPSARASTTACAGAELAPTAHNAAAVSLATLCVMNQMRSARGLRPLRYNAPLARIAAGQAGDMVRGRYFADRSLSGRSPLARILASSYVAHLASMRLLTAQNIGWGTGPNATPAGIVRAWMESPPHRRILLTAGYRDAGVGVSPSVPSGISAGLLGGTYAVEFGTRGR
ncbi:MAG TPA: CAP domain-containing protein [Solirubrobacteraceae bacterium]|nr:CAP domain-containing protein [Solirubrobacteraceae bacterium]